MADHRLIFAWLLLASSALAQTVDSKAANHQTDNPLAQQVVLARCAYSQVDEGCASAAIAPTASDSGNTTLAQIPRRMGPMDRPGPPMRGAGYAGTWGPQPSPAHALIGAAIGFGFGAVAGSKNGVRSAFAVGTLVGLLGAAIGATIPAFPSHYRTRRVWDDDEEEARSTKPRSAKPDPFHPESGQLAAARSDPPQSPGQNKNPSSAAEPAQNNAFSTP